MSRTDRILRRITEALEEARAYFAWEARAKDPGAIGKNCPGCGHHLHTLQTCGCPVGRDEITCLCEGAPYPRR